MKRLLHDPLRLEARPMNGRTKYLAPCLIPGCEHKRWLQRTDLDSIMCASCQKLHLAHENIAHWRENPTAPEQAMMALLDNWGFNYTFQHIHHYEWNGRQRWFIFDFWLPSGCAIEVNGWWHKTDKGVERDERLTAYCGLNNIPILFVPTERLALDAQSILGDIWLL